MVRCAQCNKKIGLVSFPCLCEKQFCAAHRFAETHNCPKLNEKIEIARQQIEKDNQIIVASKLIKI